MFEIVFVCTGNRNRSVIAEAALRRALTNLPVRVHSVGLIDLGPAPPLPETLELGPKFGLDVSGHRARCIADVDLSGVDLVVGLELEHVAAAVVDYGAPPERTFTLLELVDLLKEVPADTRADPARRLRRADALRETRNGLRRGIPDPFGQRAERFNEMGEVVVAACNELAQSLFQVGNPTTGLSAGSSTRGSAVAPPASPSAAPGPPYPTRSHPGS